MHWLRETELRVLIIIPALPSSTEVQADKIVRKIRALEADSVWAVDNPNISHPFPGMEFLTGVCPMFDVGEI
jgi:adenosine deaminase CECR1